MAWCVWITGLPGSGKSTIANDLLRMLLDEGHKASLLRMDDIRNSLTSGSGYTNEARDEAYIRLADMASERIEEGENILIDATAHRRKWRDRARARVPRFLEVHIECSIETCMDREGSRPAGKVMAELYRKALERAGGEGDHHGLGAVPGVDEPFEASEDALKLDSEGHSPAENARAIYDALAGLGWLEGSD